MIPVLSFNTGAGGMVLGFENLNFRCVKGFVPDNKPVNTLRLNFPSMNVVVKKFEDITFTDLKHFNHIEGFLVGAPLLSWAEPTSVVRERFFTHLTMLLSKIEPRFFIMENTVGMNHKRDSDLLEKFFVMLEEANYRVSPWFIKMQNYGLPQHRERIVIVGYHGDTQAHFLMSPPTNTIVTMREAIEDLPEPIGSFIDGHVLAREDVPVIFQRQKVPVWDEPSPMLQPCLSRVPFHPSAPAMERIDRDSWRMVPGRESEYRRLTVRECARLQGFPDTHFFVYHKQAHGYMLVGSAMPPMIAEIIATQIKKDIFSD